jgi:type IV secretory pathway protease TraF
MVGISIPELNMSKIIAETDLYILEKRNKRDLNLR